MLDILQGEGCCNLQNTLLISIVHFR
jgi:hypothetical protein